MGAPFLPRRQQVAIKAEVTEGTDSVPAAVDVIAPTYDVEYEPSIEMFERDIVQSSFSRVSQRLGEQTAVIRFSTELKGSGVLGTPPPNLSAALQACGLSETIVASTSVTYDPVSESIGSVTVEIREGSANAVFKSKKIVGARGTFTLEAVKGDVVMIRFEFTGRYIEPSDTVALTTPSIGTGPVSFLGAAFSFQGDSLKIQNFNVDMSNEVVPRNDVNQPSGTFSAIITGRNPSGSIDPEQEDTATANFFANWTGVVEGILAFTLTGAAGNVVAFNAPKAQISSIAEGDRDAIRIETLDLQLNEDTDAGDDELSLVFT